MRLASTSSSRAFLLHPVSLPSLFRVDPPSLPLPLCLLCLLFLILLSPPPLFSPPSLFFVGRADNVTCNMVITMERAPGPTWMLDVVAQPLNRLPGAYGKGSTTGQRHASLASPGLWRPGVCITASHAAHESSRYILLRSANCPSSSPRRRRAERRGKTTDSIHSTR